MPLLSTSDRTFAGTLTRITYSNPFRPERIALEKEILGGDYVDTGPVWNWRSDLEGDRPNLEKLAARAVRLADRVREALAGGGRADEEERILYEDLVLYILYHRNRLLFEPMLEAAPGRRGPERVEFYETFERELTRYLNVPGVRSAARMDPSHLFACFFQIRRAFHHLFREIIGGSEAAARLRATAWESIFTHDMRRYRRTLWARMGDVTTLITGPSGTGKELVARAIGLSRYVRFDPRSGTFAGDFAASFHALNLAALPATLVEAELFGHRRGAFTGATADREGWLETCPPHGTVFLDEIGDLAPEIQVKLLRVLQGRTFQRLGDVESKTFRGKIVAATNRDLPREIAEGTFREDLYYRLCADLVTTPPLRDQIRGTPEELHHLIVHIARRVADDEAEAVAAEVEAWIAKHLGPDYPWPGNVRELEQCVRNVLVRGEYRPAPPAAAAGPREALRRGVEQGTLTADELLRRYATKLYAETESYEETAQKLAVDRRTAKSYIDPKLLESHRL